LIKKAIELKDKSEQGIKKCVQKRNLTK